MAATGLDYREVCKKFNVSWKNGRGLIRDKGIDLDDIKNKFSEYFDIVEDFYDNTDFVPDEFKGSKEDAELQAFDLQNNIDAFSHTTLNEFVDEFSGQGIFLVSLVGNPNAKGFASDKDAGHIVCVYSLPGKRHGFFDTWDSGDMYVDAYMRIAK